MHLPARLSARFGRSGPRPVVVREYGRDSLLVWANLLLAPVFARLGLRIGLQSEERLAARIEADATAMRRRGYLVASVGDVHAARHRGTRGRRHWHRVRYEL
ncbi:MAG TPA: hypothetical protein VIH37_11605, partial [Candidatus Limnocylindrales bacterium]